MKFFAVALLASTVLALPHSSDKGSSSGQMTAKQGQDKCGSKAQLSCCNSKIDGGDAYNENKDSMDHGALSDLLNDNNRNGLGVYDQCSEVTSDCMSSVLCFLSCLSSSISGIEFNVSANELAVLGLNGLLSDKCQQNIACCDASNAKSVGLFPQAIVESFSIADLNLKGWWIGQHHLALSCLAGYSLRHWHY